MKLEAGARVVYPNQGICRVRGVEAMEIGGLRAEFVTLVRERDGATVRVPRAKATDIGVRPLATPDEARDALLYIRESEDDLDLDWKSRQKAHLERMTKGGLPGMVEVLRNLFVLSELRALPQRERETYDQVRGLLVEEIGTVLDLPPVAVEDQLDLALVPPPRSAPAPAPAKKTTGKPPAKKKPAGKPPAKKTTRKAPAKKKPARKAAAKKTTRKAPAKAKPARKAAAKKTTRKAPAKKKPARKAAAKKTTRKAPAKKKPTRKGRRK